MNQYDKYNSATINTSSANKFISVFDNIIKVLNDTKIAAEKKDTLGKINGFNKVVDAFRILKSIFEEAPDDPLTESLIKFYHSAMEKAAELNTKEFSAKETDELINTVVLVRDSLVDSEKKGKLL